MILDILFLSRTQALSSQPLFLQLLLLLYVSGLMLPLLPILLFQRIMFLHGPTDQQMQRKFHKQLHPTSQPSAQILYRLAHSSTSLFQQLLLRM